MDLQRSLLIGAAIALSFMLLIEWVAFKDEHTAAVVNETPRMITHAGDGAAPSTTTESIPSATANQTEEDLPTTPETDAALNTSTSVALPDAPSADQVVVIASDVLELAVDLRGGDIVELALPKHLARREDPNNPLVLLQQNEHLVYIAQSGLIGPDGIDKDGRAQYTAVQREYALQDGENTLSVDLHLKSEGPIKVIKRFTLRRGDYLLDVDYIVENNSDSRWQGNLFGQIKRDSRKPPASEASSMGMQPFLGFATTQPEERFTKFKFGDLKDEPFKAQLPGGWMAMIQHYFLSAWIPNPDQSHSYSARATSSGFNIGGFTSPALVVDPGRTGSVKASFYAGPKDQYRLKEISPYLDLSVDYGFLWWIAQPLFWLLTKFYALVGNWGVAIILLTVLIKGAFFKLSAASYRSMANMRRVQPKLVDIREQYADDRQKQSQAMMDLYKKEKINPMGGCLPILVQMPVFIGLYWMLMESVELRHAPFFGWIQDLSVMDPYFVLPLLMGASMYFMQKMNPPPPDPMQAKIMQYMPVMFTFFFLWFPAGLVLYWLVNNLLSMAQQYYITRQIEKEAAKA